MTKYTLFALLAAFVLATPAHADDTTAPSSSDVNAIYKDNNALAKDNDQLARDRAAKAQDKATGNWAGQAGTSVGIGVDHVVGGEKQVEKGVDQQIAK